MSSLSERRREGLPWHSSAACVQGSAGRERGEGKKAGPSGCEITVITRGWGGNNTFSLGESLKDMTARLGGVGGVLPPLTSWTWENCPFMRHLFSQHLMGVPALQSCGTPH